jgi:hypothetical protein
MNASHCARGFTADDVLEANARGDREALAHIAACPSCQRMATLMALAKTSWRDAMARDDAHFAGARERRLSTPKLRPKRSPSPVALTAVASVVLAGAAFVWLRDPADERAQTSSADPRALVANGAPGEDTLGSGAAPPSVVGPEAAEEARAPGALSSDGQPGRDARRARLRCSRCTRLAAAEAPRPVTDGDVLEANDAVQVPKGATLVLGFAVAGLAAAVDAESIEVTGPATVRALAEGASDLEIDQGALVAQIRSRRVLRTPELVVDADDASVRIVAGREGTRVAVLRGRVFVRERGATAGGWDARRLVSEGESFAVAALRDGRSDRGIESARAKSAPVGGVSASQRALSSAEEALAEGDRARAEKELRAALGDPTLDAKSRARANLTLAQLELARGDRQGADARLEPLVRASDPKDAFEAALLRAQARPEAAVVIWSSLRGRALPSPERERAAVAEAQARFDAGDVDGAKRIVATLERTPELPDVAAYPLRKLKKQIENAAR